MRKDVEQKSKLNAQSFFLRHPVIAAIEECNRHYFVESNGTRLRERDRLDRGRTTISNQITRLNPLLLYIFDTSASRFTRQPDRMDPLECPRLWPRAVLRRRMPLFAGTVGRGGRVLECSTLHQDYSAPDTRLIPMGGMLLYQHLEKHPPFIIISPPARESSPPS